MATRNKIKRDWFDYAGPAISAVFASIVLLVVSKGCATSEDTHSTVTHLNESTIPLLQKDVTQIQKDVTSNKADLETKNQGLQGQIKGLYDQQSTLKDKLNEIRVEQAKHPDPEN